MPDHENSENGLGLWLWCGVGTPSENCAKNESGLGLWLGVGWVSSLKIVKMV